MCHLFIKNVVKRFWEVYLQAFLNMCEIFNKKKVENNDVPLLETELFEFFFAHLDLLQVYCICRRFHFDTTDFKRKSNRQRNLVIQKKILTYKDESLSTVIRLNKTEERRIFSALYPLPFVT